MRRFFLLRIEYREDRERRLYYILLLAFIRRRGAYNISYNNKKGLLTHIHVYLICNLSSRFLEIVENGGHTQGGGGGGAADTHTHTHKTTHIFLLLFILTSPDNK